MKNTIIDKSIALQIIDMAKVFYSNTENQKEFEEWQMKEFVSLRETSLLNLM